LLFLRQSWAKAPAGLEDVMGKLPKINHRAPLQVQILGEEKLDHYLRRRVTYVPEPDSLVHAWLLIPNSSRLAPAALCLHQTTSIGKDEVAGLGGKPNLHYGDELARRGYVVLAPDYPSFGEDKTDFARDVYARGYASGSMKGVVNHVRGVDLLASLPEVNAKQIAAIGHSLGGHNSLFLAVFDPRIQAVVTSCGFTSLSRYYGGNLKGWTSDRYMPRVASRYHNSPKEVPFEFTDIFLAIAPRPVFVNAPVSDSNFAVIGVDECVNEVKGRFPQGKLVVMHPECGHDFPLEIREKAYQFLDDQLRFRRREA
jgi:dienelactone hydrolase